MPSNPVDLPTSAAGIDERDPRQPGVVQPAGIIDRRVCAEIDGPFVLFLIGIRINAWWKPWLWLPVFAAMPRMLVELARHPELGLLHARTHFGLRNTMVVQYWRSFEQLQAYAIARDREHLPAQAAFNRAIGSNGDVGIWHESYLVDPGKVENIYANMPPWGMGVAGQLQNATGPRALAAGRLQAGAGISDRLMSSRGPKT